MNNSESRNIFLKKVKDLIPVNPTCVEIGVHQGVFTEKILTFLNPDKLYLIDPWAEGHDKNAKESYAGPLKNLKTAYSNTSDMDLVTKKFTNQITSNQVTIQRGYSYDFVDSYPDNFFDFIYIDGCHLYDSVKADLEMFLPKLKNGGLMCGHDYVKYLNFGVIEAVDEFCKNFNFEMVIHNNVNNDWALKKINNKKNTLEELRQKINLLFDELHNENITP